MRKILSLLTISLLVFFTACDLNTAPEFDDNDAFVAFDNAAMSIEEDKGTLKIPVTLASIKGLTASIDFELVDSTAKLGENYNLVNETTTLTFDAQNRTQFIEISIVDIPGVFTGDLRFVVKLSEDGTVKPSVENTCTVTIQDLDHPLALILGTYKVAAETYFDGAKEWEMEILKDEDDVSVVWFKNIVGAGTGPGIYGIVNEEKTEISLPLGQIHQKNTTGTGDGNIYLYGMTADVDITDEGNLIIKIQEDGAKLYVEELGPALNAGGTNSYFQLVYPDYYCTKL